MFSFALVKIRFRQLSGQVNGRVTANVLAVLICIMLAFTAHRYYDSTASAFAVSGGIALLVFLFHRLRSDLDFVHHHLSHPHRLVLTEYFIFTLPVSLPALITPYWHTVFITWALLYFISLTKPTRKPRARLRYLSRIIPSSDFEVLSGLRRNFFIYLFFYVLALAFCWVRILPLFFLWLITVQCMAHYGEGEPLHILRANDTKPAKLIRRKILRHTSMLAIVYLPVLVLNAVFNEDFYWVNILFILLQASILGFAIMYKYKNYEPLKLDKGNILFGLVSFSGIVPFLLPVPLIMCIGYYPAAISNLKNYFND